MNKKILIVVLSLMVFVALVGGTLIFLKSNPPLETNTLASNENQHSVIVGFGNKGWGDIQLTEVAVNNYEEPTESKIQMSNAMLGFIITDDFESVEAQPYRFTELDEATIKTGTSPTETLEKQNNGTASEDDETYGLSVMHDEEIHTVHIKYSYFGIPLFEEVELSF
ncbi:hypothetical protein KQ939_00425 [Planococcus sp. CP5-4]|uniref:hypothetical protein n=1 Tax=unclassified Planococcus (in: firmicutes) TaxID=2662419 RepID=UPI001C24ACAC|nr:MULTISPECIES: hypothetical protein [unclassified Planococcus (in: firmicutes)]MBU9673331.1 hypothetical protein [Planococcus sp. CP5-4_YE]MBV0908104.1 hypothetical protein [Planococcus sp. CP5-4_UN]MBW6062165.1 hypothetical protein [Planococcus sp. CP5-4]